MPPLGPLIQLGLVVPDLDVAVEGWLARGVGPFFEMRQVPLRDARYRGQPTTIDMSVAITYSGATQIELIASRGDAPSVYRDFLEAVPAGGLHHLAFLTESYDDALSLARAEGRLLQEMTNAVAGRFAYLERDPVSGAYIELIESQKMLTRLFEHMRATCAAWDGSDPRRTIG